MAVSISELMYDLGFPELTNLYSTDDRFLHLVQASIIGLSDGDLVGMHDPITDDVDSRLFGALTYNDGEVAQKVLEASVANGPDSTTPIYAYQTFLSEIYANPRSRYAGVLGSSVVELTGSVITIDGNSVSLGRNPRLVIDMPACLHGQSWIDNQIRDLRATGSTYTYTPITRTHFTNYSLFQRYDNLLGEGAANKFIGSRLYIGREDGVAVGTESIIDAQEAGGMPADIADLIICANAAHTTRTELQTGISNSAKLLRTNGTLAIRAFSKPAAEEIGEPELSGIAEEAGLMPVGGLTYTAPYHNADREVIYGEGVREYTTTFFTRTTY